MYKVYKQRIAASEAALDQEMRTFAHFQGTTHGTDSLWSMLIRKFPAIDKTYANDLAKIYGKGNARP